MSKKDIFRFKQFSISHVRSGMKIGTDAILLGSWVNTFASRTILDIGTGCGIIALMLAQRSEAMIEAIDIDKASIEEAFSNFENSPWAGQLHAHHTSLQNLCKNSTSKYDLIVSNPPYFQNSLHPSGEKLKLAKHNLTLSYDELLRSSAKLLNPGGRLAVIIPFDARDHFIKTANSLGLYLSKQLSVHSSPSRPAIRIILVFDTLNKKIFDSATLTIRTKDNAYTDEYKTLTHTFHPFLRG
jgi:tRNA1Val (adenine37-N6)-methyltransferase